MLSRATFIPASASANRLSRWLDVGPMVQTILVLRGSASGSKSKASAELKRWSTLSAVASAAKPPPEEVRSSRRERVLPSALVEEEEVLRRVVVAFGAAAAFSAAAAAASSASWTPVLYPESGAGFLLL